jgi:hypothetical protein
VLLNLFILAVIDVIETLVYVLIYGSTDTASDFVFGTWRRPGASVFRRGRPGAPRPGALPWMAAGAVTPVLVEDAVTQPRATCET